MSAKISLTNEKLRDRFDNPFTLVNYAITLAKKKIARGDGLEANPVLEVLESIAEREDVQEDVQEEEEELEPEMQ